MKAALLCLLTIISPLTGEPVQSLPKWFPRPPALPHPSGSILRVSNGEQFVGAAEGLSPGSTLLLEPGTYHVPRPVVLRSKTNVMIRSMTGQSADVVLMGKGWAQGDSHDDILRVANCDGVTIAGITFAECRSYGVKVEAEHAPRNVHIYACRFRNIGVRAIKGSAGQDPQVRAINGSVRYCEFMNDKIPPPDWLYGGDYIGGIDMMALENWTFGQNVFRNINGRNGGGRAAIFVWVRSRGIVVENNLIVGCDRGISFGNPGLSTANEPGAQLVYVSGGSIRNNFIAGGADCGIELWHVENIDVVHNSIWRPQQNWHRGIRVGAGTAKTRLINNLVHGSIHTEGGQAETTGNVADRLDGYFVDPESGNLALTPAARAAIDQAVTLPEVSTDIKGAARPTRPDVGAWEFGSNEAGSPR
jgi:hypothetical protein